MPTGYYSSAEKNAIRQYYDLPLLQVLRWKNNADLRYFGLPGEDIKDIITWGHLINFVHAVDRKLRFVEKIEKKLITQYSDIRAECHWGEIDRVILENRGKKRNIGGQQLRPLAHTLWCHETDPESGYWAWDYNVINLDYYGPFLPQDTPEVTGKTRDRADALRKLFDLERQDARNRWILLITVEAKFIVESDITQLKNYLISLKDDSSEIVKTIIDFFLSETPPQSEQITRLVHSSSAILILNAANNAGLRIFPRGTIFYHGAHDQPMIHLVYEFEPTGQPFSPAISREFILCTPLLKPKSPLQEPWFELLPEQPPGLSVEKINACLGFLDARCIRTIIEAR
jgi:hypothetical protein